MPETHTIGELRRAAVITDEHLEAAVAAHLAGAPVVAVGPDHTIDAVKAVEAHKPSREVMADPNAAEGYRRTMVLTAIILGRPEPA